MTDDPSGLRDRLRQHRLVVILRARQPSPLLEVIRVLVDAGVRCLEVTVPTPGAMDAITAASREFGDDVLVGGGTVTTVEQVRAVARAGARFTVSPTFDPQVVRASREHGLGSLPGVFTPTEALAAWRCAPSAVKLFPAGSLGPQFVSALAGPLPDIPMVPTGGIGLAEISDYLAAGALAVGVGSPLLGDALAGGPLPELHQRATRFVAALDKT